MQGNGLAFGNIVHSLFSEVWSSYTRAKSVCEIEKPGFVARCPSCRMDRLNEIVESIVSDDDAPAFWRFL